MNYSHSIPITKSFSSTLLLSPAPYESSHRVFAGLQISVLQHIVDLQSTTMATTSIKTQQSNRLKNGKWCLILLELEMKEEILF